MTDKIADLKESNYVKVYADRVESNIDNFEFTYDYIGAKGMRSLTYLRLQDAVYVNENNRVKRLFGKNERKLSGLVLARLSFQVFEKQILDLDEDERKTLTLDGTGLSTGLWTDKKSFMHRWGSGANAGIKKSKEYVADLFMGNRYETTTGVVYYFYNAGLLDSLYCAQNLLKEFGNGDDFFLIEVDQPGRFKSIGENDIEELSVLDHEYSLKVLESRNVIFRGAPGTGKSYLALEIAANIISDGKVENYKELTDIQRQQVEFVQFHPSYDYTDFVEGIRPISNHNNEIQFRVKNGIFKDFVLKALNEPKKPYVFIIDEINRGEISKILGELFFSIDPGYRGKSGSVTTQYANLHETNEPKFYIPDNVYIIGTMNDIDRSVDSFDFAMRRRFRFIEVKADSRLQMLEQLDDLYLESVRRLKNLNDAISKVDELNDNYHIGPSYFLKLDTLSFDELWDDYLFPLLQDYIRGLYNEEEIMNGLIEAYINEDPLSNED